MVLPEGFDGGAEDLPLRRPLQPPGELSFHLTDISLSVVSALALVLDVREFVRIHYRVGETAAFLAQRIVGDERLVPSRNLGEDLVRFFYFLDREVDGLSELALGVELMRPYYVAVHPQRLYDIEEGLDEVVSVIVVLSARAGYVAYGHADVLLELLRKEIVSPSEGIERIDEVDEPDIRTQLLQGAAYRFSGDGLPQASYVKDPRGADTRRYYRMFVLLCHFFRDDVCPVHAYRAVHLLPNIKGIVGLLLH